MLQVQFDLPHAERIQEKLQNRSAMVGKPLGSILNQGGLVFEREVRILTPVDSGRLIGSWTTKVDRAEVPKWSRMGTNVKYAQELEESKRKPRGVGAIPFFKPGIHRALPKVKQLVREAQEIIAKHWGD
ncbi:MAG: HK97 gp10 family phage protein [Chloroflexota bacterium]|nr:HK97 gp10 family phage protein [Chloroflexota bacterium]